MFKKKELVYNFLKELATIETPTEAITLLLHKYIAKHPDELPAINLTIGKLSTTALEAKNKQLNVAANSMQNLIALESIGTKLKNTTADMRVVSFVGAMITMFPTGEKLAASALECKFYNNFVKDLKEWDLSKNVEWAKRCGYYDYLKNLLKINELSN